MRDATTPKATPIPPGETRRDSASGLDPETPDRRARRARECSFCPRPYESYARFQGGTADWCGYWVCSRCLPGFLRWALRYGGPILFLTQKGYDR
jgi:hypothetical protein